MSIEKPTLEMNTLIDFYNNFLRSFPLDEKVICCDDTEMTLGQLDDLCNAYAIQLAEIGVKPGISVGYTMPNSPQILALVIALSRLGACIVPVFHMIPDVVKAGIFKKSRASFVITTSSQANSLKDAFLKSELNCTVITIDNNETGNVVLRNSIEGEKNTPMPLVTVLPSMPFLMTSSSGTTGIPKAVLWTQANAAALLKASMAMAEPVTLNGKIGSSAVAFPLASAGVINLLGFMFAGVRLIFSTDVSPVKFISLVNKYKPDSMAAPPAYFEGILTLPMLSSMDTNSVSWIFTGMDFLSPLLLERLCLKFPNIEGLGNGYGLIETTNVFMLGISRKEKGVFGPTNLFQVVEGLGNTIEVRNESGSAVEQGETGELFVKGISVIRGYIGNDDETARCFNDGWFRTGDVVRCESGNSVTLLGRKKYLIKRGGKSISPVVVQDCLNKIPNVKESAVVGVPHPLYGEMVWAFVAPLPGHSIELKDVMKHCRSGLASYMVPDQVTFTSEIPKKPGVGKVDFDKMIQLANNEITVINGEING